MWQISGPLWLLLIWVVIFLRISMILDKQGVCQLAQNGPICKFSTISCTKSEFKGGRFYEKNANSCIWGPILWAVWQKQGFVNRPRMDQFQKFSTISCKKSKLKGSPFYEKNCQCMYLGPHNVGCFEQIRVSANQPKLFDKISLSSPLTKCIWNLYGRYLETPFKLS